MARRLFDSLLALLALLLALPVLGLAALGIKLSSPGPVLFRTRRVGKDGRQFVMLKLRTMHQDHGGVKSRITGVADPRIFPFGQFLRRTKVDELPQLINIVLGDMAIVGPRPEVPGVVARHYAPQHRETLNVRPGLTSPGSLYHYTIGEAALTGPDTEARYFEAVLPTKLALDIVYVRRQSLAYDLAIMARTATAIASVVLGRTSFAPPRELAEAQRFIVPARNARTSHTPGTTGTAGTPCTPLHRYATLLVTLLALSGCLRESPPIFITFSGGDLESSTLLDPQDAGAPGMARPPAWFLGAGNIGCDDYLSRETAALLDRIPGTVFTTGDHDEACAARAWDRHRPRLHAVAGEKRWGAASWYSYDVASWHVIALNSGEDMGAGSPQHAWLQRDLAANYGRCTIAIWHRPRFASGRSHGDTAATQAVWQALYDAGIEIVLNGHEEHYERFAPQDPAGMADWEYGIRQFIVGTGGESDGAFGITVPNSERRRSGTAGVLVFNLREEGYDWRFVPVRGDAFTDAGSGSCHSAPPWAPRPARRHRITNTLVAAGAVAAQP